MPFSAEQFFEIFEKYNQFIYPMQAVLILAALYTIVPAAVQNNTAGQIISGVLAFLWCWAGIFYHLTFFTRINPAAYIFGALFVIQGALFFYRGVIEKRLNFRIQNNLFGILGAAFIIYALVIYPVIGSLLGRWFPFSPTFGAPCPTVIYTLGFLMWTEKRTPLYLIVIPFLWAGTSTLAALRFGIYEDFGLLAAAVTGTFLMVRRYFASERER